MPAGSLYETVMGGAVERLAEPVRAFHLAPLPQRFAGRACVERGKNPLALVAGALIGLPRDSADCELEVVISGHAQCETWTRRFAGKPLVSRQLAGKGGWSGLMVERMGAMAFAYALDERQGELHLDVRGWRALGVPMPRMLGPRVRAFERGDGGRFCFDVEIGLPLVGRLVRYRGWLTAVD